MVNPPKLKYNIVPNASENMQGRLTGGRELVSCPLLIIILVILLVILII